jgi:hypothetical protein
LYTTPIPAYRSHRSQQLASANQDAWYEQPSYVSVFPEEFFDSQRKLAAVCPETALMYAVLEDAFVCFHKQFSTEQRLVRIAREAEEWFFSDDSHWLFSFVSVCDALGLEREYIRKKLKREIPSSLNTALATK